MNNFNWNYNPNDYSANKANLLEEGKYRVRVIYAKPTMAKNGTEGLEISLEVCGHTNTLRHYIWYNRETPARTNQLLGEFFNSFGIQPGEMNDCGVWTGKDGAVYVVHDSYKGHVIAKVAFCIAREHHGNLPASGESVSARTHETEAAAPTFNSALDASNECVHTVPPQRQMSFDGFKF